jgi:hypothetical protein
LHRYPVDTHSCLANVPVLSPGCQHFAADQGSPLAVLSRVAVPALQLHVMLVETRFCDTFSAHTATPTTSAGRRKQSDPSHTQYFATSIACCICSRSGRESLLQPRPHCADCVRNKRCIWVGWVDVRHFACKFFTCDQSSTPPGAWHLRVSPFGSRRFSNNRATVVKV